MGAVPGVGVAEEVRSISYQKGQVFNRPVPVKRDYLLFKIKYLLDDPAFDTWAANQPPTVPNYQQDGGDCPNGADSVSFAHCWRREVWLTPYTDMASVSPLITGAAPPWALINVDWQATSIAFDERLQAAGGDLVPAQSLVVGFDVSPLPIGLSLIRFSRSISSGLRPNPEGGYVGAFGSEGTYLGSSPFGYKTSEAWVSMAPNFPAESRSGYSVGSSAAEYAFGSDRTFGRGAQLSVVGYSQDTVSHLISTVATYGFFFQKLDPQSSFFESTSGGVIAFSASAPGAEVSYDRSFFLDGSVVTDKYGWLEV